MTSTSYLRFMIASNHNSIRPFSTRTVVSDTRSRHDLDSTQRTCTRWRVEQGWNDRDWKWYDININHTCETTCGNTQEVVIRQRHVMHAWQDYSLLSLSCLTSLNWWSRKSEKSRHKMDDECCWGGGSSFSLCTGKARLGPACRNKSALCRISLASPSVDYLKR